MSDNYTIMSSTNGVKNESSGPEHYLEKPCSNNDDLSVDTDFSEEIINSESPTSSSQSYDEIWSEQPEEVEKTVAKIASLDKKSTSFIARVAFKSSVIEYDSCTRFCVDFVDETGRIFAVIFDGDHLFKQLLDSKIYHIENFDVRDANEFSTTDHPFELKLSNATKVVEVNDESHIPRYRFNFKTIPALRTVEIGLQVDIIAICKRVAEVEYPLVNGDNMARRDVLFADSLGNQIYVTFWADNAEHVENEINPGKVVAIRGATVKDFYQPRNLSIGKNAFKLTLVDIHEATTFLASLGLSAESFHLY